MPASPVGRRRLEQERLDHARRGHGAADPQHGSDHNRHGGIFAASCARLDQVSRRTPSSRRFLRFAWSPRTQSCRRRQPARARDRGLPSKPSNTIRRRGVIDAIDEIFVGARRMRSTSTRGPIDRAIGAALRRSSPSGPPDARTTIIGVRRGRRRRLERKERLQLPDAALLERAAVTEITDYRADLKRPGTTAHEPPDRRARPCRGKECSRRRLVDAPHPSMRPRDPLVGSGPRSACAPIVSK